MPLYQSTRKAFLLYNNVKYIVKLKVYGMFDILCLLFIFITYWHHFCVKEGTLLRTPVYNKSSQCQPAPQTITSASWVDHVQNRSGLLTACIDKLEIVLAWLQMDLVATWMVAIVDADIAVHVPDLQFPVNVPISLDYQVTVPLGSQKLVNKLLLLLVTGGGAARR